MKTLFRVVLVFLFINVLGIAITVMIPFFGGLIGSLLFLVSIIVAIVMAVSRSSGAPTSSTEPLSDSHGTPTFSWKGVAIYRDEGFFTFHGRRYPISEVRQVSYETSGRSGCMGGTHYRIHIHLNNLQTPRLSFSAGNVTSGGNEEVERNYDRLQIAFGFHG